jgi:hypothetical protein
VNVDPKATQQPKAKFNDYWPLLVEKYCALILHPLTVNATERPD